MPGTCGRTAITDGSGTSSCGCACDGTDTRSVTWVTSRVSPLAALIVTSWLARSVLRLVNPSSRRSVSRRSMTSCFIVVSHRKNGLLLARAAVAGVLGQHRHGEVAVRVLSVVTLAGGPRAGQVVHGGEGERGEHRQLVV